MIDQSAQAGKRSDMDRFETAIGAVDGANAADPNMILAGGAHRPAELVYSERMTETLNHLYPKASEALRLAVHAQHIQRWQIPRSDYPMNLQGYRRWRNDLKNFHAEKTAQLLKASGYDQELIGRVGSLVRKERLKTDEEAQALEDVACLVFLKHYFADFASKHDDEKLIGIVRKTWAKMSDTGRAAAAKQKLPEPLERIVQAALEHEPEKWTPVFGKDHAQTIT
ncbi:MAG: DUF4202 domain-containing protein [Methyloligellaceae bacterium]